MSLFCFEKCQDTSVYIPLVDSPLDFICPVLLDVASIKNRRGAYSSREEWRGIFGKLLKHAPARELFWYCNNWQIPYTRIYVLIQHHLISIWSSLIKHPKRDHAKVRRGVKEVQTAAANAVKPHSYKGINSTKTAQKPWSDKFIVSTWPVKKTWDFAAYWVLSRLFWHVFVHLHKGVVRNYIKNWLKRVSETQVWFWCLWLVAIGRYSNLKNL